MSATTRLLTPVRRQLPPTSAPAAAASAEAVALAQMSETEFARFFTELVRSQQEWIESRIDDGALFIRSRGKTIHTLDCNAGGFRPRSRMEAWSARVPGLDPREIRALLSAGKQPPMPELLDRVDLALPGAAYRRCRVCTPDVPDIDGGSANPGSHDSVESFLRYIAQKYQDRPSIALLKVLELHECTLGGTCAECATAYPCRTAQSVWHAYDGPSAT